MTSLATSQVMETTLINTVHEMQMSNVTSNTIPNKRVCILGMTDV